MSFPLQIERAYLREVQKFLEGIDKEVMAQVKKEINFRKPIKDGIGDIVKFLSNLQIKFENMKIVRNMEKSIRNVVKSVNNFSRDLTKSKIKKVGLDPEIFKIPPPNESEIEGIIEQNVALIKTVGKEYLAKINQNIRQNILAGKSQAELIDLLEEDTKVERSRAKFWASDQLGKAYSTLTKNNQKSAGFDQYIWRTQKDGRVRDTHAFLEGKKFLWDDGPVVDGRQIHPGDDYNCRCFAEPVLQDEEEDSPGERLSSIISILQQNP